MAVSIKIADASFSKVISKIPPFWADCSVMMLFGESEAASRKNIKTGDDTALIGAPTYGVGFANVGGAIGFDTGVVSPPNSWTHCVVSTVGAGNGLFIGNWSPSATNNALGRFNTAVFPFISGSTRGSGTPYPSATGFTFMAASHDGVAARVYVAEDGALTSASGAYPAATVATSLRVGGLIGSGTTSNQVAAALSFTRVLSNAEVQAVHDYLKFTCGRRGIVVV